jgi:hypothetical protein
MTGALHPRMAYVTLQAMQLGCGLLAVSLALLAAAPTQDALRTECRGSRRSGCAWTAASRTGVHLGTTPELLRGFTFLMDTGINYMFLSPPVGSVTPGLAAR